MKVRMKDVQCKKGVMKKFIWYILSISIQVFCVLFLLGCSCSPSVEDEQEQHDAEQNIAESPQLTISFENYDFSDVTKIVFYYYYLYPEDATVITEPEEVEEICGFLRSIVGVNGTSNKGYSGGTYHVELYSGEILKDFFFFEGTGGNIVQYGNYDDQYWVRYEMVGMTGEEVDLFFDQHKSE